MIVKSNIEWKVSKLKESKSALQSLWIISQKRPELTLPELIGDK